MGMAEDRRAHALKLKDEVTWLIDGLSSFAAVDPDDPTSNRAAAWAEGLSYLQEDLDRVIGDEPGEERMRWEHEEVIAMLAKMLKDEGKGSDEGSEHLAREIVKEWRSEE